MQQLPDDGRPAAFATQVYFAQLAEALLVVVVASDPDPSQLRARMVPRERIGGDDVVTVMLDPDHDQRRAYAFRVNPRGVQWDALWTEGQGFDVSFDAVWHSEGLVTDDGYVTLIEVPFKSLRFPSDGAGRWGIVVSRTVPRGEGELSYWPRVSNNVEGVLTQAAALDGLTAARPGLNTNAVPYTTLRSFRAIDPRAPGGPDFVTDNTDGDMGLDLKQIIDDRFVLDVTANPDFSQVESDRPQVTVNNRFEVFFPERRPFFTENADYFRTPLNLLFTRRVRDPRGGARFTGRAGRWSVASLVVDDEAPRKLSVDGQGPRAFVNAARASRDVGRHSRVGALYVGRELGDAFNRTGGFDARARLSDQWTAAGQAVWSATGSADVSTTWAPAYTGSVSKSGSAFSYFGSYTSIDPDFTSTSGFVPRTDIRRSSHFASYFRRSGGTLLRWGPELFVQHIWDHEGVRTDDLIEGSLEWVFVGGTYFEANYRRATERLRPVDFPALDRLTSFDTGMWDLEYGTSHWDWLQVNGNYRFGHRTHFTPPAGEPPHEARWRQLNLNANLSLGDHLRVTNTVIRSDLRTEGAGELIFDDWIVSSRWNWQFDRQLSLRAIVQYEHTRPDESLTSLVRRENLNGDVLVTYRVNPWTALFVGYNGNLQNRDVREISGGRELFRTDDLRNDARQFFVKLSYLLRL